MKIKLNKKKLYSLFILLLISIDQIIKIIFVYKTRLKNGLSDNNLYYIMATLVIIFLIIRYILNDNFFIKKQTKIVLGFALAGAISNLIDRLFNSYVINYINIGSNININLAYIYILITWIGFAAIFAKNTSEFIKNGKKRS